ncbi:MAG: TIGR02281 family clan AA aspartic protease [Gammaproteobacteria bacterium]|nr:TIGR02281 family clan AA aspartic protease [Gammaproteobacteria bacterium]MDJ0871163.1 TIGR02281 family clan AA aspartic protease [Gammaproteobacteria bacterium]MDJ0890385.1 TIGR02281 family clan AA aspartic protease [Gammaproteobacteria bacterium]
MKQPHHSSKRLGFGMIVAAWVVLLGLLTVLFGNVLETQQNPNRQVQGRVLDNGIREVVLQRNRSGHYVANGRINGQPVRFLLDTGATTVSIPAGLAGSIGLERGRPQLAQTANGVVTTYATRLDSVELGELSVDNVRANINPGMRGGEVLLGMSFLKQLEFTQRGDTLTIRQYP